jgi:polyhydroxyalkanoate synthesis regulator phasin
MESGDLRYLLMGALAELRDRTERMASDLVEKGRKAEGRERKSEASGERLISKEMPSIEELADTVSRTVEKFLGQMGLVTKSDMESLERRMRSLERKLDRVGEPAKKPRAAKKPKQPA